MNNLPTIPPVVQTIGKMCGSTLCTNMLLTTEEDGTCWRCRGEWAFRNTLTTAMHSTNLLREIQAGRRDPTTEEFLRMTMADRQMYLFYKVNPNAQELEYDNFDD